MNVHAHLEKLNPEQRLAVEHGITGEGSSRSGPLLIIAGAGTGKTTTLAHRVAHHVVEGADPRRILLLTFSRRAAAEMGRRVQRIVATAVGAGDARARKGIPWSGTFHAIGARLLRQYANHIGLAPSFTIHDREDSADLMNLVRHEIGLSDQKNARFPLKATCLAIYSRALNAQLDLATTLNRHFPWCSSWESELRGLFDAYVAAKQRQSVLDYDDLLLYWAEMMKEASLAEDVGCLFDHVLVDEYQDTNALQAAILLRLKPDGRGLTVVGDDAQSIYGFRAASVRNILDFPGQYTPRGDVVTLEQNYRSTQSILTASNGVIGLAQERFAKTLRSSRFSQARPALVTVPDEARQADFVVEAVLANREAGIALKSQAVLFRTSHHSGPLEIELTRRNIPFVKFGGLKFLEAAHIKDLLAVLRWVENPGDRVAGFRVLQLLPGVGPAIAGKTLDRMVASPSPYTQLALARPPAAAAEDWPRLTALLGDLHDRKGTWPEDLRRVRSWYQPHLESRYEDALVRLADLDQLLEIASGYPSRERFLTELTLDPPDATSDEADAPLLEEDYLILSTIHSAKGLEWKAVFILNVVDGCIPSDMATGTAEEIEEERRLLYVAMTRAKDQLSLITPQRFFTHQQARNGDRHVYASRSRFIPSSLLQHFEARAWPLSQGADSRAKMPALGAIDLGARMRGMWRA
jgi:DNA helicase-2/ATP-dependent DNA helicase PcrA